jgi:hypothetical protein
MRTLVSVVAALAALAGGARAREIDVAAGSAQLYARSRSMDALASEDAVTMGALEVSVELGRLPRVDRLHVEVGYFAGSTRARDFDQFDASLTLQTVHAGARAMHLLSPRWRVFARLDVGMTFADLELSEPSGTATPIRDGARGISALLGAGIEVTLVRFPYFDVALRGEADYFAAGSLDFQAEPGYPDDDLARIPTVSANLGSIDPSGAGWRFVLVGRF